MRKPMLQAIVMGAVAVAGMLVAQHGLEIPDLPYVSAVHQPGRPWLVFGLAGLAIGGWFGVRAGIIAWMRKQLIDNPDAIARWTVSPDQWAMLTGKRAPPSDIPVVIDSGAVVIGDSCTPIPAGFSLLTYTQLSSVDWIENGQGLGGTLVLARMFGGYRQRYITFLRAPVPEAARSEAQAAIDALDPLISDDNREKAERWFGDELSAARSGDPDAASWLLARRLLSWGGFMAVGGGLAWWISTLPVRAGEAPSAWVFGTFGPVAFFVGLALVVASFFMSR